MKTIERRPTLLYADDEIGGIDPAVMRDLNAEKLISEDTLAFLCSPAGRLTRSARNAIFKALGIMDGGEHINDYNERFCALRESAGELLHSEKLLASASGELAMLLGFDYFVKHYLDVCGAIMALPRVGAIGELLGGFIDAREDELSKLRDRVEKAENAVGALSCFTIKFTKSGVYVSRGAQTGLCRSVRERAAALGYNIGHEKKRFAYDAEPELCQSLMKLYPNETSLLRSLHDDYKYLVSDGMSSLKKEADFYLELYGLYKRAAERGISACYAEYSEDLAYRACAASDISLLVKNCDIIPNDIDFDSAHPVYFLTGANGGGKTTYLRAAALNLIFALNGAPVYAESAEVGGFNSVFTHFPSDESFTGSGRLVEEAARADAILAKCGIGSFAFLNETYSGTDDKKGAAMTLAAAKKLAANGAFALYVTHFHEVTGGEIPSLTTKIDDSDSASRTYRIMKCGATSNSFALDILRKYSLDAASLESRRSNIINAGIRRGGEVTL